MVGQTLGFGIAHAHSQIQGQAFDAQVVFCGNFLGRAQVKTGLRIAHARDGGGAHFKVAFGRGQLFLHRLLLGLHGGQAVLAGEHVKVGLRDAHQQVLLGCFVLGCGLFKQATALFVGGPSCWAVDRLGQGDRG